MTTHLRPLGRVAPPDWGHVDKYRLAAIAPLHVEVTLRLPSWVATHDQGSEGSCVGHGTAMERSITNTGQNMLARILKPEVRYDPIDIWNEAKAIDVDPGTNPGDDYGTTVRAGYDVMRQRGPRRVSSMRLVNGVPTPKGEKAPSLKDGCEVNRWATSVDEIRACIARGQPVTIGVNWYSNFDTPAYHPEGYWIAKGGSLGRVRGGHCVCVYGASDKLQAVRIVNSWGSAYPQVWLPYNVMDRLLTEEGEATVVTDR